MKHLMRELEESQQEAAMLTHALADKKAEHQIEVNRNLALERDLEKSQQNEERLKSVVADFQTSACGLQEVAQRVQCFVENVSLQMDEAFRKLAVFSQRITFASGRVKFLQGQYLFIKLYAQIGSGISLNGHCHGMFSKFFASIDIPK